MTSNQRVIIESAGAALVAYVAAATIESAVIRSLQPSEWELAWVSDVILSIALGVAVYLWRHLLTTRHELAEHERADLVLETQLSLASDIQRRLLPPIPPMDRGFDWAASLQSAGKIGGDFFDFVETARHTWIVLVADVSGKGIPAAMALGSLRAAFRALAGQGLSPSRILNQMSLEFLHEWRGVPYFTCIVVAFDLEARTATYTNAGHPPGLIVGRQGTRRLDRGGPPAGLIRNITFEQEVVQLHDGDICLLVSDGVTESLDGKPLIELDALEPGSDAPSAKEVCDSVMARALQSHGPMGVPDWDDDRTVVVVTVRPNIHVPRSAKRTGHLSAVHAARG